ncbi:MAG: acyltransferase [Promethearchaeota archaeon]
MGIDLTGNRPDSGEPDQRSLAPETEGDIDLNTPITTTGIPVDKASAALLVQFAWGVWVSVLVNFWYLLEISKPLSESWYYWLLFPFWVYGLLYTFAFSVFALTALWIRILWRRFPPREGLFDLDSRDYKFWKKRYHVSLFACWLARALPLPWIDLVFYKMLGVKVGRNAVLYDTWLDTEFVEIENFVMLSLNSAVVSHCLLPNGKFYIKKVRIEEAGIVGAMSVVAPGTVIEEGATLGAACGTHYNQVLDKWAIHVGNPARFIVAVPRPGENKEKETAEKKE